MMETMELEAKKASLVRDILTEENTEYISKEEVLAGIDAGLKEMQERKCNGRKAKTLQALIDEL